MFNIKTSQGIFRRYLLRIRYDGSRFPEMATSPMGLGVMDTIHRCFEHVIQPSSSLPIRVAPSSRTDSGVHALRNSAIAHIPLVNNAALDETPEIKAKNLDIFNTQLQLVYPLAIDLVDIHSVSPGFCSRRHASYRHYAYRLVVPKIHLEKPSLPLISESSYSWILRPGFDPYRAAEACQKLEGVQNVASFFKHPMRQRRFDTDDVENTIRWLRYVRLTRGEAYSLHSEDFDYYNINIISRSFVREQIRRMVGVIVAYAYGRLQMRDINWLLTRPDPRNFFAFNLKAAPPNGLFLADVVYDPKEFLKPQPYCVHPWDFDEVDSNSDECNSVDLNKKD